MREDDDQFFGLVRLQLAFQPLQLDEARLAVGLSVHGHIEPDDPHVPDRVEGPGRMARPQSPAGPCLDVIFLVQLRDAGDGRDLGVAEQDIVRHVQMGGPFLEHVEGFLVVRPIMDLVAAEHDKIQLRQPPS